MLPTPERSGPLNRALDDATRQAWQAGSLQVLRESELWSRLGLIDASQEVKRLYTPVMLAELIRVPVRAVRHWHRKGHLEAERSVGRLPYFHFEQVRIAQRLAELLSAGCSLSQIDRKLDELARVRPDDPRPLADPSVVVEDRRLYVRRGEQLTEPSGQLLIDFDAPQELPGEEDLAAAATIPFVTAAHPGAAAARRRSARTNSARWPTTLSRVANRFGPSRSTVRS